MNNLKKTAMGLMVGAMAIGFSAFTNAHKAEATQFRFYNRSGISTPSDKSNYVFQTEDMCQSGAKICSEVWELNDPSAAPQNGDKLSSFPNATLVSGSDEPGNYTGE